MDGSSRSNPWVRVFAVVALALLGLPSVAAADDGATLEQTERAYMEVDFERTRQLAKEALAKGGHEPRDTARLYSLLGIALATLGETQEARAAFRTVLAIDPETKLDKALSPKIRAPYLEARGEADSGDARFQIELRRAPRGLTLLLSDPLGVAQTLSLRTRTNPKHEYLEHRYDAARETLVDLKGSGSVEYVLSVLDEFGNSLYRLGSEQVPARAYFGVERSAPPVVAKRTSAAPKTRNATPYYVTAGVLGGLGLAAGGSGLVFHLRREEAADEWNGRDCETPGLSRGEQCRNVNEKRELSERLAIGLYAGGGALLVSSIVALIAAPSRAPVGEGDVGLTCEPNGHLVGLICGRRF